MKKEVKPLNRTIGEWQPQDTLFAWFVGRYYVDRLAAWETLTQAGFSPAWFPYADECSQLAKLLVENDGYLQQDVWLKFYPNVVSYLGTLNQAPIRPSDDDFALALQAVQLAFARNAIADLPRDTVHSLEQAVAHAESLVAALKSMNIAQDVISNEKAADMALDELADFEAGNLAKTIVPTGFRFLDGLIGGNRRGEANWYFSPAGMGKSQLTRMMLFHAAGLGLKCVCVTLEMDTNQVYMRQASAMASVNSMDATMGYCTPEEYGALRQAIKECKKLPIQWVSTPKTTLGTIEAIVNRSEHVDFVLVDHVKLLGDKNRDELKRMSDLSQGLKQLAMSKTNPDGSHPAILVVGHVAKTNSWDRLIMAKENISYAGDADAALMISLTTLPYPAKHKKHKLHTELLRELQFRFGLTYPQYDANEVLEFEPLRSGTTWLYIAKNRYGEDNQLIPHMIFEKAYNRFVEGRYNEWMLK